MLYLSRTPPHKPVILPSDLGGRAMPVRMATMMETDWSWAGADWLDENKLADKTIVVFTSDNGPENTWRKRIEKSATTATGFFGRASGRFMRAATACRFLLLAGHKRESLGNWSARPICWPPSPRC